MPLNNIDTERDFGIYQPLSQLEAKEHEVRNNALSPNLSPSITPQKQQTSLKTAVQIWLIVACVATVLGATSDILHLFDPSQQSGTQIMNNEQKISIKSDNAFPSPTVSSSPTAPPMPTATPTATPTTVPTATPLSLPIGNPTVVDAGFEIPVLGHAKYQYNPTGSSWTFNSATGIAANGSAFTANNPNAPQGRQVAFLQETGSFSQTISFRAGSYQVSFYAAQRRGVNKSAQNFQVLIDGDVVGTFTPTSFWYKRYSTGAFTVATGSHVLTFQGLDSNGGDNTAFIDVVAIQ
jgi:hypothetical protein